MTLTAKLHHDHRSYHVEFDGEIVVVGSRDPEFDLARVLRDRGLTGSVIIVDGKTGRHRSTVTDIEKAAGLCTIEFGARSPHCQAPPEIFRADLFRSLARWRR